MKQNIIETILGAIVILVAGFFLVFAYKTADLNSVDGYTVYAEFDNSDGLISGTDVRISGVNVGSVSGVSLNKENYRAKATLSIDHAVKLPYDTAAVISSEGLLGGKYLSLEPGADEEMLDEGDTIEFTQATPSLEKLIGQAIFSMNSSKESDTSTADE